MYDGRTVVSCYPCRGLIADAKSDFVLSSSDKGERKVITKN